VGVTSLRDILAWFGPPEYIIDGTQTIPETHPAFFPGVQIPTRVLSSREGEVLLVYTKVTTEDATAHASGYSQRRQAEHPNDVMIFVRKADYKVAGVILPKG
jgi:hypothetical protein